MEEAAAAMWEDAREEAAAAVMDGEYG